MEELDYDDDLYNYSLDELNNVPFPQNRKEAIEYIIDLYDHVDYEYCEIEELEYTEEYLETLSDELLYKICDSFKEEIQNKINAYAWYDSLLEDEIFRDILED